MNERAVARRRALRAAGAAILAACLLAGCIQAAQDATGRWRGSHQLPGPDGPGPGVDQTKRSPCACLEVPLRPGTGSGA